MLREVLWLWRLGALRTIRGLVLLSLVAQRFLWQERAPRRILLSVHPSFPVRKNIHLWEGIIEQNIHRASIINHHAMYIVVYHIQGQPQHRCVGIALNINQGEGDGFFNPLPFMWVSFFRRPTDDGINIFYDGMVCQLLQPWWFRESWWGFFGVVPLSLVSKEHVQLVVVDKFLDFILELNALRIMAMIVVVEAVQYLCWLRLCGLVCSFLASDRCPPTCIKIWVHGAFRGVCSSNLGGRISC